MQEPSYLELNCPVMVWAFYRYGALLVAMETTDCVRSCLNVKKILLVSNFHISHKKFGNKYVYSKDKFWPKSPVVKYSPRYSWKDVKYAFCWREMLLGIVWV